MIRKLLLFLCFVVISIRVSSQTTDLSIVAQAQDLSGSDISQVAIFQDFQYAVTIINSGGSVSDATFEITMDSELINLSLDGISSQNNIGGASDASNLELTGSVLTGTIANLPADSSVDILILVTAPINIGGIAINAIIAPPDGTTDTNTSNNQSLISIDVIDVPIDFTITHSQITPPENTPISAWNDTVTYQFTITNNSTIDYPLSEIRANLELISDLAFGRPNVRLETIECISSTNGTECPDIPSPSGEIVSISGDQDIFQYGTPHLFTSGGSITVEMVYRYLDPSCGTETGTLSVASLIRLELFGDQTNESPSVSNTVITELLEAELCLLTDICIDTIQVNPDPMTTVNWGEEVTFETTICNNGPLDGNVAFFLSNLTPLIEWNIVSAECTGTTGSISCDDIFITIDELFWVSDAFILPVGATVTITTVVTFFEPECTLNNLNNLAHVRSGTNLLESEIFDSNIDNSTQSDFVMLPDTEACPFVDIGVTKIQIDPELPQGGSMDNTTQVGNITYEITAFNSSDEDAVIELVDLTSTSTNAVPYLGTLLSIECVSTTGDAECFDITNTAIGEPLDGIPQAGNADVFWEITEDDNWVLPANSSVTFIATIAWETDCSIDPIPVNNEVSINHANSTFDDNNSNNSDEVITYFAPCVDLVVQTFPEFTQVNVNQNFDWIIDITNSENSSNAINISFEDIINDVFTINGTPTCEVTNGNATCISNLQITDNIITGDISNMDAGSTIRFRVPVTAPSFGGAYNNIASSTANETDNREVSPETNTSISNVQIVAPLLDKVYDPETIFIGEQSVLTFTISNLPSNPSQSNISFTDVFSNNIVVVSAPEWVESNGCTATFIGAPGDSFAGVTDLIFPDGVSSCTFSVVVTSSIEGEFLNDTTNFQDQNNIDTSGVSALLTVLDDTSDVDIEVLKSVAPEEAEIGNEVTFSIQITNLGTTEANAIEISDQLPESYLLNSFTVTDGTFDPNTGIWTVATLNPNQEETLTLSVEVVSVTNLNNIAILNSLLQPDQNSSNNTDNASVFVDGCVLIPEGFSPNDDGLNDLWEIECIELYPENSVKVFNRLGVQVYESENYENNWNGVANMGILRTNNRLPVGAYFYIIYLDQELSPRTGWLYINY